MTTASGQASPSFETSRWQLYLEQLPRSYATLCNWAPSDAEELQIAHACETAAAAAVQAREQWRGVLPLLKDLGECCCRSSWGEAFARDLG